MVREAFKLDGNIAKFKTCMTQETFLGKLARVLD